MKHTLFILALAVALGGCSTRVQTTSGKEYLSQYSSVPVTPSTRSFSSKGQIETLDIKSIDQRVREVAAVEPVLKFPARIGLARIDGGLTNIPAEEAESWSKVREKLGSNFGEFVPVNPMVARMVANDSSARYNTNLNSIIDTIRLGAARQHLDAVLIYEVISRETSHKNIFAVANASIIGGYILPSTAHDAVGVGNALLIDVVQAYPYGTINTVVDKKTRLSSSWGWGSENGDREAFAEKVKSRAAQQLSEEAYDMFMQLRTELAEKRRKK